MNPFKSNDRVVFQGEWYTVRTTEGVDVLIENSERRMRVHYLTVESEDDFYGDSFAAHCEGYI